MQRIITIIAILLPLASQAQIITDWDDDSGIIHTWKEDTETVHGFNETLEQFSETEDKLKALNPETELPMIGKRAVVINKKEVQVPTMIVDGTDFYMLMEEGIRIYMAASPTAFYEEPDSDTIKWIRYYAFSKRQYTAKIFKRYAEWQKFISLTMQSEGVPVEIGLLCLIESGCTFTAISKKGATGMWQFMPATAQEMGLEVSSLKDMRTDPIESTKAAARYLKTLHGQTGNWTLAIASYNCGPGRTLNLMRRHKTKDWAELKNSFPTETQQYIPALQAIHYVWTYQKELGF